MKKRLTQKDMAQRLGVSQALVSRSLSGTADRIQASPATIARIRQAAAAWNYHPSAAARTLRGAPTRTLGVMIKNFDDPYFGHLIGEMQRLARVDRYALLLAGGGSGMQGGVVEEPILHTHALDGLILCGSDFQPAGVGAFIAEGKPVAQIGLGETIEGVRQVAVDQARGFEKLVDFLSQQGHAQFGFIGHRTPPHRRRQKTLAGILAPRGLALDSIWSASGDEPGPDAVRAAIRDRVRGAAGRMPTALIAADDTIAQAVLRSLYEHGIRVPRDISLAGVDDIPAARMMIPALTTLRQPLALMVWAAFQAVTGGRTRGQGRGWPVVIEPDLVVRESCATPRAIEEAVNPDQETTS